MGAFIKKHRFVVRECFLGTNMGWGPGVESTIKFWSSFKVRNWQLFGLLSLKHGEIKGIGRCRRDIFLCPPARERARTETGGANQWVLTRREFPGFARVNKVSSSSLGYPLSVFNKKIYSRTCEFQVLLGTLKRAFKNVTVHGIGYD